MQTIIYRKSAEEQIEIANTDASRHCERSEAIQCEASCLDCFVPRSDAKRVKIETE